MASKKTNKISIRPIGNAQAIASTLGIGEQSSKQKTFVKRVPQESSQSTSTEITRTAVLNDDTGANVEQSESKKENNSSSVASGAKSNFAPEILVETVSLPLIIEIKRRLPGKELFVLSLLYKQKNNRGLVQITVNSLRNLYYSVFEDTIKDETARRSLKRLADASLIKTKSIPGHNAGYVYEIDDLVATDAFAPEEKEEFSALLSFVEFKLNSSR